MRGADLDARFGELRRLSFAGAAWILAGVVGGDEDVEGGAKVGQVASLAIASGADVKVVQQMLGHKSATMTLDLYGHLFEHRLDEVASAMDAARSRGLLADCLRTDAELIRFPTNAGKH